jgi:hypothetical protein
MADGIAGVQFFVQLGGELLVFWEFLKVRSLFFVL